MRQLTEEGRRLNEGDEERKPVPVAALLSEAVEALGKPTAVLLFDSAWMIRRKDSVEMISDEWARRQTSVDVSIPVDLEPVTRARDGRPEQVAVPITLLPKLPPTLMRFDFVCGSDRLTMPTRRQNGLASFAALLWAAGNALSNRWPLPPQLREELLFVALGAPEYAAPVSRRIRAPKDGPPQLLDLEGHPSLAQAESELIQLHRQMSGRPMVALEPDGPDTALKHEQLSELHDTISTDLIASFLLRKLATSSVVLAHVGRHPTGRQRIALSYDEGFFRPGPPKLWRGVVAQRGWRPYPLIFQTSYVGAAAYHFELVMPGGLEVIASSLVDLAPEEDEWDLYRRSSAAEPREPLDDEERELGRPEYDSVPVRGQRIHLYRAPDGVSDGIAAQVYVRAQRDGFIESAWLAGLAVAVTLWACALLTRPLVHHANGAPSLLLLFPGLMVALAARGSDHALYVRLLRSVRRSLMWCGVFAFSGAALLALIKTGEHAHAMPWHRWYYLVLAVAATWQAGRLGLARRLPTAAEDRGFLGSMVGRFERRAEQRAKWRARWAQRSLLLGVSSAVLTSARATEIVGAAEGREDLLPLAVGPSRRRFLTQEPSVMFATTVGDEPVLAPVASAGDHFLIQEPPLARRMAATIRWLASELPDGYDLTIRWAPVMRQVRRALRHLARHGFKMLRGADRPPWAPKRKGPLEAAEVAAAARRGDLHMNRVYVVAPSPASASAREDSPAAVRSPAS
jgi:hypothetical protein